MVLPRARLPLPRAGLSAFRLNVTVVLRIGRVVGEELRTGRARGLCISRGK